MKPLFRWPGGKRGLRDRIRQKIDAQPPALFVEPFIGAGAIGLSVAAKYPQAQLLFNDANAHLISLWRGLVYAPALLQLQIRRLENLYPHTSTGYEAARQAFNHLTKVRASWASSIDVQHDLELAAFVLYLGAHGYNGLWRVNSLGEFNSPFGGEQQAHFRYPAESAIAEVSQLLRGRTTFLAGDFEATTQRVNAWLDEHDGDGVCDPRITLYADPPYVGGFDLYTADGFADEDQRRLADCLQQLACRGVRIIASNADDPLIREIYAWATIEPIAEARRIAAKPTRRKKAPCVLITCP